MERIENQNIEFKELNPVTGKLPNSISKSVVAFANTEGGIIYIGIQDDGTVLGVDNPDDVMTKVTNTIHDTIAPDVMPFVSIEPVEVKEKIVIEINVSTGVEQPYYLKKQGLTPGGVYIRRGSACVPVHENGIREMMMQSSGKSYEESRSFEQDLTFEALAEEMEVRHLEFGLTQMKNLKMIGKDGLYTNLALLLSDQCPFSIKVAVFQDSDYKVFRDRKECRGSLIKQMNDAYKLIDFYNKTKADFHGLRREDVRDYPEEALREALINSVIHRDYLFSGSTIINMLEDHVEFLSLGGLISGLSMDAVLEGLSQTRNPNLASVFYRMELVEAYGTGIRKINGAYECCKKKPTFKNVEGAFVVKLPNLNMEMQRKEQSQEPATLIENQNRAQILDVNREAKMQILEMARVNGIITRQEVEKNFGFKTTKAFRVLKELCESNLLQKNGAGRVTTYSIK